MANLPVILMTAVSILLRSNKNEMAFKMLAKPFWINYIYHLKRTGIGAAVFGMWIRGSYVYYTLFCLHILLAVNQLQRCLLQIRFLVYSHPITRPASSSRLSQMTNATFNYWEFLTPHSTRSCFLFVSPGLSWSELLSLAAARH